MYRYQNLQDFFSSHPSPHFHQCWKNYALPSLPYASAAGAERVWQQVSFGSGLCPHELLERNTVAQLHARTMATSLSNHLRLPCMNANHCQAEEDIFRYKQIYIEIYDTSPCTVARNIPAHRFRAATHAISSHGLCAPGSLGFCSPHRSGDQRSVVMTA